MKREYPFEYQFNGFTFTIDIIHVGQYHPYGDFFRVFDIHTECQDPDIILQVVKDNLRYDVPLKKDWNPHDPDCYFTGYCEVTKIDDGFRYTKCEPYDD